MAQHGWGGDPPASDEEARQRIVDGCVRCIDRYGVRKTTLSDVAAELGVTRPTVYRYFSRMSDLMGEVGAQGAQSFLDRMVEHLRGLPESEAAPARVVVESILFSVSTIPAEPRLGLLLQAGEGTAFGRGATSGPALVYGAQTLRRFPVDWAAVGVTSADLDGLAELMMRLMTSLLQNPGEPRDEEKLRAWLTRWIAPALSPGAGADPVLTAGRRDARSGAPRRRGSEFPAR